MLIFTHGYKLCNVLNILLHSKLTCVTFFIDRENVPLQRADFEFFRKVLLHHHPLSLPHHRSPNHGLQGHMCPSPLLGCGPARLGSPPGYRREDQQGGPRKWETQAVRHEDGPRLLSWLVFILLTSLSLLTTPLDVHRRRSKRHVNKAGPTSRCGPTTRRTAQLRHVQPKLYN
jgi:hypothetical protein